MRRIALATTAALLGIVLLGAVQAQASQTVHWTGNGLDSVTDCVRGVELPHLHWVLTPGGAPVDGTSADLFINGKFVGTMTPVGDQGALQLTTTTGPFTLHKLSQSTVFAVVTSGSVGENAVLTISDGCVCPH